jgi:hypothetical protein
MQQKRNYLDKGTPQFFDLPTIGSFPAFIKGHGREIMRHGDNTIHGAFLESIGKANKMSLFAIEKGKGKWKKYIDKLSGLDSLEDSEPSTHSNTNGIYVAYIKKTKDGKNGAIVHIPDLLKNPEDIKRHEVTPADSVCQGSFLQASRNYNSVVYGWYDTKSGSVYVGVSKDGINFPKASPLVIDKNVLFGPAVGIYGKYILVVYKTNSKKYAPKYHDGKSYYHVFIESGDCGESWTAPACLHPSLTELPSIASYAVTENDFTRKELNLSGYGDKLQSLQALAWSAVDIRDESDGRIFAMSSMLVISPKNKLTKYNVALLSFKPIEVGGSWQHVVTNNDFFTDAADKPLRISTNHKYSALPQTPVRAVSYIEKSVVKNVEDRVVIFLSTDTGQTWPYRQFFNASELKMDKNVSLIISNSACLFADADGNVWLDLLIGNENSKEQIKHVVLPTDISVSELDPTLTW